MFGPRDWISRTNDLVIRQSDRSMPYSERRETREKQERERRCLAPSQSLIGFNWAGPAMGHILVWAFNWPSALCSVYSICIPSKGFYQNLDFRVKIRLIYQLTETISVGILTKVKKFQCQCYPCCFCVVVIIAFLGGWNVIVKLSSGRSNCPVLVVRRLGWMVHELDLMAGPLLSGRE